MLNKDGQRELAYVVKIDGIEPIVGSDNCEAAVVGGWRVMTRKGTFKVGDLAIYFEIDSKVPAKEPFDFLEKKHYKVKTQKYTFGGKGNFVSQGLLMSAADFGGMVYTDGDGHEYMHFGKESYLGINQDYGVGEFLTSALGVTYSVEDDNKRKAKSVDRYKAMAQRRPDIFKKRWAQWFMRRGWGKRIMFMLFGKKRDVKKAWPAWVVKTDEERIENMVWALADKTPLFATEKIDGTSTTFTMKGYGRKRQFFVCSRNVVFDKPDKGCYYDTNVYLEMAEKYDIENKLAEIMEYFSVNDGVQPDFVTIQGETYGESIQKRDYHMEGHDFMAFNLIVGMDGNTKRFNPKDMTYILSQFGIPCVPILAEDYVLPDTVEELREYVNSEPSRLDQEMKEGIVFRGTDGVRSFKCVSPEFLIRYHG